jgi:hypothetical protein
MKGRKWIGMTSLVGDRTRNVMDGVVMVACEAADFFPSPSSSFFIFRFYFPAVTTPPPP